MKSTHWNSVIKEYSSIQDARRELVFPAIMKHLRSLGVRTIIDYGGGDGSFSSLCAEGLSLESIVSFDPADDVLELSKETLSPWGYAESMAETTSLSKGSFEAATFNAVWMCLRDWDSCINTLSDIHRLLQPGGWIVASVTHPCFRNVRFRTYAAEFDMRNYLRDGIQFPVDIFDEEKSIRVIDTHWTIGAMSRQLEQTGFILEEIEELSDRDDGLIGSTAGSPWLIIKGRKT